MTALENAWDCQEFWAERDDEDALCLLDLRRRVEALEARAATEQSSAPEPAPAADRPLWEVMYDARCDVLLQGEAKALRTSAEIDAVASWLEQRYLDRYPGAAELLRAEAQRAREGA